MLRRSPCFLCDATVRHRLGPRPLRFGLFGPSPEERTDCSDEQHSQESNRRAGALQLPTRSPDALLCSVKRLRVTLILVLTPAPITACPHNVGENVVRQLDATFTAPFFEP